MRIHRHLGSPVFIVATVALAACHTKPTGGALSPPKPTVAAPASTTPAFENPGGMWMPEQMPLHAATLESLGLQIPPSSLANPDVAPLGAVVSLGGCTGSFVSPDGLIATNHHCVTGYLAFASAAGKDYRTAGFHARTRAGEAWAGPGARVLVTRSIKDVTAEVRAGIDEIKDDVARVRAVEKHTKAIVTACEKGRPQVRCSVASFFRGAEYRLTEMLELKDLRLVYVPPESIGSFGGDIDNWRWPRHAGDFAFLRVYVGKDGEPAEHAASNVPYKPPFHLPLPSSPLRAGDLVFVAGYPGTTSRLKDAAEVEEAITWAYPRRIESYSAYIPLLESFAARSKELEIKTSVQLQGLSNYLINAQAIVEDFARTHGLAEREKEEAELLAFIDADAARKAAWGGAVQGIDARLAALRTHREHDAMVNEMLSMPRLLGQAMLIVRVAEERAKPEAQRDPDYRERNIARFVDQTATFQRYYDRGVEEAVLGLALERAAKLAPKDQPKFAAKLLGKSTQQRDEKIAAMYAGTKLEDVEVRKELLSTAKTADLKKLGDPLLDFALAARKEQKQIQDRDEAFSGALLIVGAKYAEARRAFAKSRGRPDLAPDANGTLRITYGTVRGYRPRPDAPVYYPFTTLAQLAEKATGKPPFDAPEAELEAIRAGKKGPYLLSDIGDVPVDFLSDLDITGGNSGSPTMNARGELVGLAFDGNYEGVASDWLFMPDVTRTIHVDARYILWVLDAVAGAKELLAELNRTPAFTK